MVDTPTVAPGPEVGAPQPAAAPAPEVVPAAQPTESVKASEITEDSLGWIDHIGTEAPQEAIAARSAPYGQPSAPQPYYAPTPAYAPPPTQPAPGDLISAFVRDPEGFVAGVAKKMAAEQVTPFVEALREYVNVTHRERVVQAVQGSRERLKEYARGDNSLANQRVAAEVNNTYNYFIANAARGNPEAIAALNNPMTPYLVTQAAKMRSGMTAPGAPTGPVTYAGGTLEGRSTVGPRPQVQLDPTTLEFGRQWGLSDEQIVKNEQDALNALYRK